MPLPQAATVSPLWAARSSPAWMRQSFMVSEYTGAPAL